MGKKKVKKRIFTSADLDDQDQDKKVFTALDLDAMDEESLPNSTIIDTSDPNTLMKDEGTLDTWHAQNPIQTGLASLANMSRGATMGVSDLIAAGSRAIPGYLGDKSAGGNLKFDDVLLEELNKVNAPINDLNESSPYLTTGLQMLSGAPLSRVLPAVSGGGRLAQALKAGALGTVGGATYGVSTTEGDVSDRLQGGIISGGVGGVLGSALGAAFGGPMPKLIRKGLRKLPEDAQSILANLGINLSDEAPEVPYLNQAEKAIARRIPPEDINQIAIDLNDQAAMGNDVFLPEVAGGKIALNNSGNDSLYRLARNARNHIDASRDAGTILRNRTVGQESAVDSVLARLSDNKSLYERGLNMRTRAGEVETALKESVDERIGPVFNQSFRDVPEVEITPGLRELADSDIVRPIISKIKGEFPRYRESGYGTDKAHDVDPRSMIWQKTLERVNDEITKELERPKSSRINDLNDLKSSIETELYQSNTSLKNARQNAARIFAEAEAFEGEMISAVADLRKGNVESGMKKIIDMPIERIAELKQKMGDPELFETTAAAYLRKAMGGLDGGIEKISKMTDLAKTPGKKMKLALGDKRYNELRELLDAHDVMTAGTKKYGTGSTTETNQADTRYSSYFKKSFWEDKIINKLDEWLGASKKDIAEILFNQQKSRDTMNKILRRQRARGTTNVRGIQTTVAPIGGYVEREVRE